MTAPDVLTYPLAFGGVAFSPVTATGRQWCVEVLERNPAYPAFRSPDGCMTGFAPDDFGVEPCDVAAFADDAKDAGIVAQWGLS